MSIHIFEISQLIQWALIGICTAAVVYAIATVLTPMTGGRWQHRRRYEAFPMAKPLGVSVLKPLCGDEPRLYENLATFCDQTHPAFQLICGVASPDDPAVAVVRRLQRAFPEIDIVLVSDDRIHGANRKVSNLINMAPFIRHPWIVIADSDIAVERHYLQRVTAPLLDENVGVVTCLYRGVSVSGVWPRMGALFINQWFAPSVRLAHAGGSTRFGFGATLALRATTLAQIGGLTRLKDVLADDYWLAEHARQRGLKTVLSSEVVATDVVETHLNTLWSREIRWLRTIRSLNPLGFSFLFITFTSPWLMMAGALSYVFFLDAEANAAMETAVVAVMGAATEAAAVAASVMATDGRSALSVKVAAEVASAVVADVAILASIDMAWMLVGITGSGCVARVLLHGRSAHHTDGFWRDLPLLPIRDCILLLQWMTACFGTHVAWRGASITIDHSKACPDPVLREHSLHCPVPDPAHHCVTDGAPRSRATQTPSAHSSSLAAERSSSAERND